MYRNNYSSMPGLLQTPSNYNSQMSTGQGGQYGSQALGNHPYSSSQMVGMQSTNMYPSPQLQAQQLQAHHMLQTQQMQSSQVPAWAAGKVDTMSSQEPEPDPDMYETCVYLGIEDKDGYDYRTKVIGEKGENLDYVRKSTNAKVLLRGKGSGVYNNRPPHIFISHRTLQGMEDAEKLAYNLVNSVKEDYLDWKAKGSRQVKSQSYGSSSSSSHRDQGRMESQSGGGDYLQNYGASSSKSSRGSSYQDAQAMKTVSSRGMSSSQDMDISRDRYQLDSSSSSQRYSQQQSSQQQSSQQQSSQQQQKYDYNSSSGRYDSMQTSRDRGIKDTDRNLPNMNQIDWNHGSQQSGSQQSGSQQSGSLHCEICDIHCPTRELYKLHCTGIMHTEKVQYHHKKREMNVDSRPQRITEDLGGTHWEGPPEPMSAAIDVPRAPESNWKGMNTGSTMEEYVFNASEKLLKMMISDHNLKNLKRSVEKIGQRDLKSAIPTQPQTPNYCKLCKESVPSMQQHLTLKTHGNLYLLRQIQLGDLFLDYYSDVPIPGVITNGGRVLAMDTLTFGPCIPETNRERFKELLVYSGAFLAYKCSVCHSGITNLGHWVQHITSKKHGKNCIESIIQHGIERFVTMNPHIPVPPPKNALEILPEMEVIIIHASVPKIRSSQRGGGQGSGSQSNSTFRQLATLSAQERQLVLQVQALTGIEDLSLIITVLSSLGGMDPAMLQTLSALDPVAIQHAMAGNLALQGMDVQFVQKVIKMYMNYKGLPVALQQQQFQQQLQLQKQQQQQMNKQYASSKASWQQNRPQTGDRKSSSRWDDGRSNYDDRRDRSYRDRYDDRDRRDNRNRNDGRSRDDRRDRSESRTKDDRKDKADSRAKDDKKDKPKDTPKEAGKDGNKGAVKTQGTTAKGTAIAIKEAVAPGKRPGAKVTGPVPKRACPAPKVGEVIDLTADPEQEKDKTKEKTAKEGDKPEKTTETEKPKEIGESKMEEESDKSEKDKTTEKQKDDDKHEEAENKDMEVEDDKGTEKTEENKSMEQEKETVADSSEKVGDKTGEQEKEKVADELEKVGDKTGEQEKEKVNDESEKVGDKTPEQEKEKVADETEKEGDKTAEQEKEKVADKTEKVGDKTGEQEKEKVNDESEKVGDKTGEQEKEKVADESEKVGDKTGEQEKEKVNDESEKVGDKTGEQEKEKVADETEKVGDKTGEQEKEKVNDESEKVGDKTGEQEKEKDADMHDQTETKEKDDKESATHIKSSAEDKGEGSQKSEEKDKNNTDSNNIEKASDNKEGTPSVEGAATDVVASPQKKDISAKVEPVTPSSVKAEETTVDKPTVTSPPRQKARRGRRVATGPVRRTRASLKAEEKDTVDHAEAEVDDASEKPSEQSQNENEEKKETEDSSQEQPETETEATAESEEMEVEDTVITESEEALLHGDDDDVAGEATGSTV